MPSTVTDNISRAAAALREAERPLRILGLLAWPDTVRARFLQRRAHELPRVTYPEVDTRAVRTALAAAQPAIARTGPAEAWLARIARRIDTAAGMMENLGTPVFHVHACDLYGSPTTALRDTATHPLALARRLRALLDGMSHLDLGAPPDACVLADTVAARMHAAAQRFFGDQAPQIEVVDDLSAKATAGPDRIRIRRGAHFTERDVEQLIHHEAGIHVTTSLNGRAQAELPILAAAHPGTTRTQEGLAVFAEFITGSMDLDRLSRLADRVLAIHMAEQGADFIEVYRYFLDRGVPPETAFEQTRRVFRGGVIEGGAPFTKDVVYIDGLLRVHDFLRTTVAAGRADCLELLFCGKLDLEDIPVLCELAELGLLRRPRFLPPWAADRRFLVSYLAYSGFLGQVGLDQVHAHYTQLLTSAPIVRFKSPSG